MRVGVIAFIHDNGGGLGPAFFWCAGHNPIAGSHIEIGFAVEQSDQIIMQPATTIEARINDHRFLIIIASEQFGEDLAIAIIIH